MRCCWVYIIYIDSDRYTVYDVSIFDIRFDIEIYAGLTVIHLVKVDVLLQELPMGTYLTHGKVPTLWLKKQTKLQVFGLHGRTDGF